MSSELDKKSIKAKVKSLKDSPVKENILKDIKLKFKNKSVTK